MKKIKWMLLLTIVGAVLSCGPLIHSETLVYGFVTDEDGLPVDSIRIVMDGGISIATSGVIAEAYSDELGFYEINVDVSHKFSNANAGVDVNGKFSPTYKSYKYFRNQVPIDRGGGGVKIGSRTRYDFKLISK